MPLSVRRPSPGPETVTESLIVSGPLVNVTVMARKGALRIAIGASVPIPVRARRAEQFLEGKAVTPDALDEAAAIAAADVTPLSDFRGAADYRREMIRIVTRRTLATALC